MSLSHGSTGAKQKCSGMHQVPLVPICGAALMPAFDASVVYCSSYNRTWFSTNHNKEKMSTPESGTTSPQCPYVSVLVPTVFLCGGCLYCINELTGRRDFCSGTRRIRRKIYKVHLRHYCLMSWHVDLHRPMPVTST